jgi:asparagine synthase (glutamine-hydrolysing)
VLSFDGPPRAAAFAAHLLNAQKLYGPAERQFAAYGDYASGRCLHPLHADAGAGPHPAASADGRFVLTADLRIDNRDELLSDLGASAEFGDCALLIKAWQRWGRGVLDRMIGDFAFALWDKSDESLLLARDTAGERPLHYRRGGAYFAFASMPAPLAHLPGEPFGLDEERMARFVADLPNRGRRSFFADVALLEPGHVAIAGRHGTRVERYWQPSLRPVRFARREDYGDALREQLDAAVRRRLRRPTGRVAAQLSSGLDSSAVATSAALTLAGRGEGLLAFTSAPREGFAAPVVAGRIADESPLAAATAALHPKVDHHVVRPSGGSALKLLETSQTLSNQPVGHVCNNLWWQSLNRAASESGASVMLTGEVGNFTISAGLGVDTLADLLRTGAAARWWREARLLAAWGDFSWLQILDFSIGSWMPESVYARARGRVPKLSPLLAEPWRRPMAQALRRGGWPIRPPRNAAARRLEMLRMADPGNFRKRSLAEWGVEERDPTNDRRLVEFCFSLPAEALLDGGVRRPALRRALAGRVPEAVLDQRLRGYQMPDWYEQIQGDEVLAAAQAASAQGHAGAVIDLERLEAEARSWPAEGWEQRPIVYRYRMELLRVLAAAQFADAVRSGALG